MSLFFLLLYCFNLVVHAQCAFDLQIYATPGTLIEWTPRILLKHIDQPLNLTCRLVDLDTDIVIHNIALTWSWNNVPTNNIPSPQLVQDSLLFKSLQKRDTGSYTCVCVKFKLKKTVDVKVTHSNRFNDAGAAAAGCSSAAFFRCPNGTCIHTRFVCDGKADCSRGHDESVEVCGGVDACEDKLSCDDGRCIPLDWCCDRKVHDNCTVKNRPKCCQQLGKAIYDDDGYGYPDHSDQQKLNDMGFLQTTIYTVIGCAMAFMFVTTVLVIAICRIHTKRSIVTRCPMGGGGGGGHHHHHHQSSRQPSQNLNALPLYNFDMFTQQEPPGGLLVTYNINNGVQFVGRPVDPPPYCEVIDRPPREGPPPPYVSRENVNADTTRSSATTLGKAKSQSDGDVARTAPDDGVNIYINRLCGDKAKKECSSKSDVVVDSDDDVSYSENDTLLPKGGGGEAAPTPTNNRQRPTSLVLQSSSGGSASRGGKHHASFNAPGTSRSSSYLTRRSLGDLSSPGSSETFRFDRDVVTMPLRESFIGVRNGGGGAAAPHN